MIQTIKNLITRFKKKKNKLLLSARFYSQKKKKGNLPSLTSIKNSTAKVTRRRAACV